MQTEPNKDGYYRASFVVETDNGEKKRITVRSKKSQADAYKQLERKRVEYENGLLLITGKSTVKKWAEEWLKTYKKNSVGAGTFKSYESRLDNHILPRIGKLQLNQVKPHHLQSILSDKAGLSTSLVTKIKNTMEQLFEQAEANGMILKSPAKFLEIPKTYTNTRRSITEEERATILEAAKTHRAGLWIKLMLYCGLRPSEAVVITWNDIDMAKKNITVNKALDLKTNTIKDTKTASGNRVVPIPDIFLNELREAESKKDSLYISVQPTTKKPHTAESMRCMWESFKRNMDIAMGAEVYRNQIINSVVAGDLTPYCLRHTYCTDLQDAGVPINVAKYLMGHSDIKVTANIYTHHTAAASKGAVAALNKLHRGQTGDKQKKKG